MVEKSVEETSDAFKSSRKKLEKGKKSQRARKQMLRYARKEEDLYVCLIFSYLGLFHSFFEKARRREIMGKNEIQRDTKVEEDKEKS